MPEVETRLPREFLPSAKIDIDTIDTREHSPTALTVHLLVVGEQAANYCRCISAEPEEVLRLKRTRGAHDVLPESYRWRLLSCKNVRVNCVGKVESSIQVLVYFQIEIIVPRLISGSSSTSGKNRQVRRTMHGKPRDLEKSSQRSSAAFFVTP